MKNEKGEDWGKYIKELQELQPLLRNELDTGTGNISRPHARYKPILGKDGIPINDPTVKKRRKDQILDEKGQVLDGEKKFAIVDKDGMIAASTALKREKQVKFLKENIDKIGRHMQQVINEWVEPIIKNLFSAVEWRAIQEGNRWPLKRTKIWIDREHKRDPLPLGTDIVTIVKGKQAIASQAFEWEV